MRLEASEEDLSLDEVIQTQNLGCVMMRSHSLQKLGTWLLENKTNTQKFY